MQILNKDVKKLQPVEEWEQFRQVWHCPKCEALYFRDAKGRWWNDAAGSVGWVDPPHGKELPDCCGPLTKYWPNPATPTRTHADVVNLVKGLVKQNEAWKLGKQEVE